MNIDKFAVTGRSFQCPICKVNTMLGTRTRLEHDFFVKQVTCLCAFPLLHDSLMNLPSITAHISFSPWVNWLTLQLDPLFTSRHTARCNSPWPRPRSCWASTTRRRPGGSPQSSCCALVGRERSGGAVWERTVGGTGLTCWAAILGGFRVRGMLGSGSPMTCSESGRRGALD